MYFPLFVGVLCWSLFWYSLLCVRSSFAIILTRKRGLVALLVLSFIKIVKHYKRVGYNMDIIRQSACLVLNPIKVDSYGFLFNCTTVGQASVDL